MDDSGNESTENVLFFNGVIAEESWYDDEITPRMFKSELASHPGDLTVWINSPGGDCFAAAEIYTALKEHKGRIGSTLRDVEKYIGNYTPVYYTYELEGIKGICFELEDTDTEPWDERTAPIEWIFVYEPDDAEKASGD